MNEEQRQAPQPVPASDTDVAAPPAEQTSIDYDRRGKPLPARQRVGGIITPQ